MTDFENNIEQNIIHPPVVEEIQSQTSVIVENKEEIVQTNISPGPHIIKVDFPNDGTQVEYINQATGSCDFILAPNGELRIVHGKMYKVPINNKTLDSDNYALIKVYSDMSSLIDVKYVKDGFALIVPIKHNVGIRHEERLCVIY